jgi:hypothetical protein
MSRIFNKVSGLFRPHKPLEQTKAQVSFENKANKRKESSTRTITHQGKSLKDRKVSTAKPKPAKPTGASTRPIAQNRTPKTQQLPVEIDMLEKKSQAHETMVALEAKWGKLPTPAQGKLSPYKGIPDFVRSSADESRRAIEEKMDSLMKDLESEISGTADFESLGREVDRALKEIEDSQKTQPTKGAMSESPEAAYADFDVLLKQHAAEQQEDIKGEIEWELWTSDHQPAANAEAAYQDVERMINPDGVLKQGPEAVQKTSIREILERFETMPKPAEK